MDSIAVTVKNESDETMYIDRDPNWDDQVLTIDGKPQMEIYPLNPEAKAVVGVEGGGTEMGVIFATSKGYDDDGSGFYQLTIGVDDSGTVGITDGGANGQPAVSYTLEDRRASSMTMLFVDDASRNLAVTMKNESSHEIKISGDPNWDDQVIIIDGKPHKQTYRLAKGASAVVGVADYNEMGLWVTSRELNGEGEGSYSMEIGPNDAGNEDVTDGTVFGTPAVKYTLHDQKPLSMTMVFVDAG